MAFLLQPQKSSKIIDDLEAWILKQKKNQKLVIGINISPQLFDDEQKTKDFIELFHKTLIQLEERHQSEFAFVLISHDLRPYNSDITILTDLYTKCVKSLKSEVFLIEERIMASEIKYIAGLLDVVITGRMHLSIASLGQGTPIGCMVYQGKFEGLFNHFNMPDSYLIDPKEAIKDDKLLDFVTLIINERHTIKGIIDSNIINVKALSKANLS
jgi:polysaccharide pyruvyl transferase WcaK-like protein